MTPLPTDVVENGPLYTLNVLHADSNTETEIFTCDFRRKKQADLARGMYVDLPRMLSLTYAFRFNLNVSPAGPCSCVAAIQEMVDTKSLQHTSDG